MKFTDMFDPDFADNNVVNTAVDVLPRVSLTVPTFTAVSEWLHIFTLMLSHYSMSRDSK